uniref:RING-type domain-containing protein n=1 Tax=Opuntia streptacantha TaxID=393608 RepID=A0A7C8ZD80_OPUST
MAIPLRLLSAVNTSLTTDHDDFDVARSDYVVILAALFCALICAIGLAMVARCVCLRRHVDFSTIALGRPAPPPPPGLNKKTLQLLPTTKYVCGLGSSDKQTDCAICLSEFADGDLMRILPQCGHIFHVICIDTWLMSHSSCPSCRQSVLLAAHCHHCGGFSAGQGFDGRSDGHGRELDTSSSHDNVHSFLP